MSEYNRKTAHAADGNTFSASPIIIITFHLNSYNNIVFMLLYLYNIVLIFLFTLDFSA